MRRGRTVEVGLLVLAGLVILAVACGGSESDESFDEVGSVVEDAPAGDSDVSDGIASTLPAEEDRSPLYAPEAADRAGGELGEVAPEPVDSRLTAGSVDDNELWDEYLLYRQDFFGLGIPVSDIAVEGRQVLSVIDVDGDPVLGASVTITDSGGEVTARLRTFADGRAVFHASTDVAPDSQSRPSYTALVEKDGSSTQVELEPGAVSQTISLDADLASSAQLDVLFLVDATGSMSDEIENLKANMISVSERIEEHASSPEARFGMVLYRDRGDEYVTQAFDFTDDVAGFTDDLAGVVADGGGDTPESLGAGLHEALDGVGWRGDDTVKLVFLIADAAPHLAGEPGYEDEADYAVDVVEAAAAGIKVFPIASSGLDAQGEFIFRQLGQVTMGRFVFLTYGADGSSPGDSTPHNVDPDDYDVLSLDDLVVELVSDELAHVG